MISKSIYKLREANHLSQAEFAELFHVSTQAVQKWESGQSYPSIPNLIAIAKRFHVPVDTLLLESDGRIIEEMQRSKEIFPDFTYIHPWEFYAKNLELEYRQSTDEGCELEAYKDLFYGAAKIPDGKEKDQIADILFNIVINAKTKNGYAYSEPSELEEIKALRKSYDFSQQLPNNDVLKAKIKGAWVGRICGCLLGKPIEGIKTDELIPLLKETKNYPLNRYIVSSDITDEMCQRYRFPLKERCWADTLTAAPVDDDTNYTVMAQALIDRFGRDFTPRDVANAWLWYQSKDAYCTAERVAFKNIINGYAPPSSAQYKNPYREWIGAQIRGDYFGYINPGNPTLAAEMAWRDASISHIKNGIYGEMFVAAMLACAAVTDDIYDIINGGLAQIPSTSRLYQEISFVLQQHKNGTACEACFADIHAKYNEYSEHDWCHTISNAMIVAAALLYGNGDFGKSVCLAVQTGFDTDCNGATVGSIVGMQKGVGCIGHEWQQPLHGRLDTSIFGIGQIEIETVTEKTMQHIKTPD